MYFPSCNFTKIRPDVSARVKDYMRSRGVEVAGCCRPSHKKLTPDDTAITVCETCNIIIGENRPEVARKSLAETIDEDETFAFPDYRGERIVVQDCFRAKERDAEKKAVRSLLRKMNVEVVELSGSEEEINFDGAWLFVPVSERNLAIAPQYFSALQETIAPRAEEETDRYLKEYCRRFTTDRVVCYCNSCLLGLEQGLPEGKRALHIAELLFPAA